MRFHPGVIFRPDELQLCRRDGILHRGGISLGCNMSTWQKNDKYRPSTDCLLDCLVIFLFILILAIREFRSMGKIGPVPWNPLERSSTVYIYDTENLNWAFAVPPPFGAIFSSQTPIFCHSHRCAGPRYGSCPYHPAGVRYMPIYARKNTRIW